MPFPAPASVPVPGDTGLPKHVQLAAQTRDGLVESIHYGSLIAVAGDAAGTRTLFSAGDPSSVCTCSLVMPTLSSSALRVTSSK